MKKKKLFSQKKSFQVAILATIRTHLKDTL